MTLNQVSTTVSSSIFSDRSTRPNERSLIKVLGETYLVWKELKTDLMDEHGELLEEWKFYSQRSGWTLKMLRKKGNLFFFTPCNKYFRLAFVFGDKAVSAIESSDLPKRLIKEIVSAKKYPEGRGIRIEIRSRAEVKHIITLVNYKINN